MHADTTGCPACWLDALSMLQFCSTHRTVKVTFTTTCDHGGANLVRDPSWGKVSE